MSFYILTSTIFDFELFAQRAQNDEGPGHVLYQISQRLGATIHQADPKMATMLDQALSKLVSQPSHWALARKLVSQLTREDVVYCAGEDIGLPLAILCKFKSNPPQIAMFMIAPDRFRARSLLKIFDLSKMVQLFTVTDQYKADYLKKLISIEDQQVLVIPVQVDNIFFTPGVGTLPKPRPLIASAGLEQRDYLTLAQAVQGQDIDIKICAFSPNASSKTQIKMPHPIPSNMELRYFEFSELRNLYQMADIVVVSLLKNQYSAGLTVLMEAMACHRPVIMTRTIGLSSDLIDQGLIIGVEPGNHEELRNAIHYLLANPHIAQEMAQRAYDYFLAHHTSENHVNQLSQSIRVLDPHHQALNLIPN